jgi:prepilin-type N-terminal cleavage/methylation domain-containing protein
MLFFILKKKTGFTMIEVMVTVAVISFSMAALSQSLFNALNASVNLSNRLSGSIAINNRLWLIEERLKSSSDINEALTYADSKDRLDNFDIAIEPKTFDDAQKYYILKVILSWPKDKKQKKLVRQALIGP